MYLLTEAGDYLLTEQGDKILLDSFATCDWPVLDDVKAELGVVVITYDAYIQRQIDATVQSLEKYLGRKIPAQVDSETFRITATDKNIGRQGYLQLRRWPILEVIRCIHPDDLSDIDYEIDEHGHLVGAFGCYDAVQVDYHGGSCPIPADILEVFWQMVAYRYAQKDAVAGGAAAGTVKKEAIPGVFSREYFSGSEGSATSSSGGADPRTYAYILDSYRAYFA